MGPSIIKYPCTRCLNCKGRIRDLIAYRGMWNKCSMNHGGQVELVVSCMGDTKPGFIEWEMH